MKKFRYAAVLLSLTLAACAPTSIVNTGAGLAQGTASTYGVVGNVFTFKNDAVPASAVRLILDGVDTQDTRCKQTEDKLTSCGLGDVPANGSTAALAFTGKIVSGSVTWRTPAGQVRALFILPQ